MYHFTAQPRCFITDGRLALAREFLQSRGCVIANTASGKMVHSHKRLVSECRIKWPWWLRGCGIWQPRISSLWIKKLWGCSWHWLSRRVWDWERTGLRREETIASLFDASVRDRPDCPQSWFPLSVQLESFPAQLLRLDVAGCLTAFWPVGFE